ncbi:MAG TPA: ATP-binding cassette domain-containing protein [Kiritimatiellia bacterium]|mgnify:CR=1 FL=1|jgi:ABC-type glutathione transport system ATPase component|nr:ATP-binding cassette domain-containing protein [Kiritimatiellia bacterium]HOM58291.1 ATP-binding cassette domain-containing protein [Kiritimatiellia bacterium]HOR96864.1 ATP-binding cassette domain-containing protein [Kiritimatiellia bacterium]HPC48954.1 ATP-binding cassette domain-containing protein [Kiritimatiellia bacterium]HPK37000.1 ATP-binding cassette domain-containing protein [Kiritimatiellia bacterium]
MLLDVRDLHVLYRTPGRQPVAAVRGVTFSLDTGESLGLVGESGCGKSSLARALIGIQPPEAGTIRFEGQDIARLTPPAFARYRRAVQMIFQDAAGSLNPRMTVRQTLEEVLRVHAMRPAARIPDRIRELLDRVGLPETVLNAFPREISGGQCQRVSFARCLALEPRLILADEPVSALDVSVQARILNRLRSLQKELNLAIILISHDLAVVRNICDRVVIMRAGEFVECGTANEVLDTPQHPYTRELLAAVPDIARSLRSKVPPQPVT